MQVQVQVQVRVRVQQLVPVQVQQLVPVQVQVQQLELALAPEPVLEQPLGPGQNQWSKPAA